MNISLNQLHRARILRIQAQREANPRPEKVALQSTFVDPRSQQRVAEQLAPVPGSVHATVIPNAKKRVYKAKAKGQPTA